MAAIELYTPQGAEMVSGMMYEPYEQGLIMRLEHHLVGGYVRYISPYIILLLWPPFHHQTHVHLNCRIIKRVRLGKGTASKKICS